MNTVKIEDALAHLLDEVARGRSLDEALGDFPGLRSELEPLVRLAARIPTETEIRPSAEFRSGSAARLKARFRWSARQARTEAPRPFPARRLVLRPAWALVSMLLLAALATSGLGVAYAADGSVPGDPMYAVDRAFERLQLNLTTSPTARAELSLAHAAERLAEAQALVASGGSADHVAVALEGYGASIDQAALALAAVASQGEEARSQALAALLGEALSVHDQVLTKLQADLAEPAQGMVDQALDASQTGHKAVQGILGTGAPESEASPAGPPQGVPRSPPDGAQPGPPAGFPPGPGGPPDSGSEQGSQFEIRVAGLEAHLSSARNSLNKGDLEAGRGGLLAIEQEVNSLSLELAAVAAHNPARAQALARVLDEALSLNEQVLNQLIPQVPAEATGWVEAALAASHAGRQTAQGILGGSFTPGPPGGVPGGPPWNPGP